MDHQDYEALLEIALKESTSFQIAVTSSLPKLLIDTGRQRLSFFLIFAALEHFRAVIHLLDDGEHQTSAFALVRPIADAAFRAIWVAHFATDQEIERLGTTRKGWPKLLQKTVTASMNEKFGWKDEELMRLLEQDWSLLSGHVHADFQQLNRNIAAKVAKKFPHREAFEMLLSGATYLWLGACWVAQANPNRHVMFQIDKAFTVLCNRTGRSEMHEKGFYVTN